MRIVIDIPDWRYKSICEGIEASKRCGVVGPDPVIQEAVYKGTPLPKGHGDLIYRDDLIKALRDSKKGFWRKKFFVKGEAAMESMAYEINDIKYILKNAPIIIEADKGEQE